MFLKLFRSAAEMAFETINSWNFRKITSQFQEKRFYIVNKNIFVKYFLQFVAPSNLFLIRLKQIKIYAKSLCVRCDCCKQSEQKSEWFILYLIFRLNWFAVSLFPH